MNTQRIHSTDYVYLPAKGRINPINQSRSFRGKQPIENLIIALSVKVSEYPDKFEFAREHNFAIEYTPDPMAPELVHTHVSPFIENDIPVRYHTRFFEYELGNADPDKAGKALEVHMKAVEAMSGLGENIVTVHLNLSQSTPFNTETAVHNLKKLTEFAKSRGITVCLENLKRGPTSNPDNVVAWTDEAGSMITMDLGHAVSSEYVNSGTVSVTGIIEMFGPKLIEVHMYAREEDRHYPITDISGMEHIIDALLASGCRWWTIELDDVKEALDTRDNLLDYLTKKIERN